MPPDRPAFGFWRLGRRVERVDGSLAEGVVLQLLFWFLICLFQIWMMVDAIRREEWLWAILIGLSVFVFHSYGIAAILYYLFVYRQAADRPSLPSIEIPGVAQRKRIKELQTQIHHLDKAHHHHELGEIYMDQGKLKEAEESYRASVERDDEDVDYQASLAKCLLEQERYEEARGLLERVCRENADHNYGQTLMAYADVLTGLGQTEEAVRVWRRVLESHSYAEARVKLSQLLIKEKRTEEAKGHLQEVVADNEHAPGFQRDQERKWVRQARALLSGL